MDSAQDLIAQATHCLRKGDVKSTLRYAEMAIAADESKAEGHQLRGIALTKLNRPEEATIAFRRATEVAPYEPKHFFNLAVNLKTRNLEEESNQMAREALRIDPTHIGARGLLGELDPEEAEAAHGPWTERVGHGNQEHVLPFMNGSEKVWTGIGYGFLALGVLLALLMIFHFPAGPTGKAVAKGDLPDIGLKSDPLSIFTFFLFCVSTVCTFMWMFIDIIDKRTKFTWLVPISICGVLGMNAAPLALYMFLGRRLALDNVTKS